MFDRLLNRTRRLWLFLNTYPPFLGAGIRIDRISPDFLAIDVSMALTRANRNYVGTHFGGSLYAMTDPFFMLMLIENLGKDYIIWDKDAHIEFVSPGRGTVKAAFRLHAEDVSRVRAAAEGGQPARPEYTVEVLGEDGQVVARVRKTLYVRKKKPRV